MVDTVAAMSGAVLVKELSVQATKIAPDAFTAIVGSACAAFPVSRFTMTTVPQVPPRFVDLT